MKRLAITVSVLAAFAAPVARAAYVSIDDSTETLQLSVAQFNQSTSPSPGAPGSGNQIDITTPTNSNGISNINHNPAAERLGFTFANQIPWGSNVTFFRYLTEVDPGHSDLFVIQGIAGQAPDYITFISNDALTGNFATDAATFGLQLTQGASAVDLGTLQETGDWQLVENTGPDQYYVRSDVPEPASLALVALALVGAAGFARRRG